MLRRRDDLSTCVGGARVWVLGQIREDAAALDRLSEANRPIGRSAIIVALTTVAKRSDQIIHSFGYTVFASSSCLYNFS